MASSMSYVEFVMEQLAGAGTITCRRMFGEYGLYCRTAPGASPTRAAGRCCCRTWRTGRR